MKDRNIEMFEAQIQVRLINIVFYKRILLSLLLRFKIFYNSNSHFISHRIFKKTEIEFPFRHLDI